MFGALCRRRPPIRKEGWVEREWRGQPARSCLRFAYGSFPGGAAAFPFGFLRLSAEWYLCNYAHFAGAMMSSDNGALFTVSAGQRH